MKGNSMKECFVRTGIKGDMCALESKVTLPGERNWRHCSFPFLPRDLAQVPVGSVDSYSSSSSSGSLRLCVSVASACETPSVTGICRRASF